MGFAETFKALSDPVRRDILTLLKKEALSAGEIGSHFDMTGATISYHLSILKKADLVFENKQKNFITDSVDIIVNNNAYHLYTYLIPESMKAMDRAQNWKYNITLK